MSEFVKSRSQVDKKDTVEFIDVRQLLSQILDNKLIILVSIIICLILVSIYCIFRMPQYSTSVLVTTNASKGSGNLSSVVGKVIPVLGSDDGSAERYSEILKSYVVIEPVIKSLGLDIIVEPNYFPFIGKKIYYSNLRSFTRENEIVDPVLGLSSFAWGGEKIQILKFEIPNKYINSMFKIVNLGNNSFSLIAPSGKEVLKGKLNEFIQMPLGNGTIKIYVKSINSRIGVAFNLQKINLEDSIKRVLTDLNVTAAGKKTDLTSLTFKGYDPEKITLIINAIADSSVQQDILQKQDQAKKTLNFLRAQEPSVRKDLLKAETELNQYRAKSGNVALEQETKITMENIARIQDSISKFLVQKGQLEQKYTTDSLQIKDVETTLAQLQLEKTKYERKLKDLPSADQIALGLMREVQIQNQIYINLIEKIQQFELLKAGTVGDVAVINYAQIPLRDNNKSFIYFSLFSTISSFLAAVSYIIVRKILFAGIEDFEVIENKYDIRSLSSILLSKNHELQKIMFKSGKINYLKFLSEIDPYDVVVEGFRSLRTNLLFELTPENNIIAISGPNPNVGKSFVSANIANIFTETGKKVLLIDGDMRQGNIESFFQNNLSKIGFCNYIEGQNDLNEIIQKTRISNLDFIPRGRYKNVKSEFQFKDKVKDFLKNISKEYDYIIIDTAPFMSVTDTFEFCRYSKLSLIVFGFSEHHEKEIREYKRKFENANITIYGFIMNKIIESKSNLGSNYSFSSRYEQKN
ncbi:polysaccharide biosynthesis tyrosine autokinase [Fluviispira multicolorata]|uniref:Polysaccharide biosynthesis tyrosine autokinase n=1 Tax=Fluviispira multicolorata TaxID=2654512 RepID=A0A833N3R7_9BACT|nr:polysaccharide biosynthesis tyrosine autokinase [Fluviispira multicolorata]KAB8030664.1 polysaccharide biosynthesis tyrosine autokinase [Fluviispira multicolorata]